MNRIDPTARSTGNNANLDALRAFAVSAVLLDHWDLMNASVLGVKASLTVLGHAGVIAFFVHTSLVLMFSLDRMGAGSSGLITRFYVRRAFRIYPLAIITVLAVLVFQIPRQPFFGAAFVMPGPSVIQANLLLVQNVIGRESVLGPLWSLPYEVQMYAVLPFLFVIARSRHGPWRIAGFFGAALTIGFLTQRLTGHANILAYIPCFLCGVLAYALSGRIRARFPAALWAPFLVLWFVGFLRLLPSDPAAAIAFRGVMSLILCLGIGLTLHARAPRWNAAMACIAKYSYGIYLTHYPAMWFLGPIWERSPLLGTALWLPATGLLSFAAFHLLEAPMIRLGRRLTDRPESKPAQARTAKDSQPASSA